MATTKKFDAAVVVREYQDRNGETKKQWQNVGAVLEFDDGGQCLILDRHFNPAGVPGEGGVRVSFFPPRARDGQSAPQARSAAPAAKGEVDYDDDVPF